MFHNSLTSVKSLHWFHNSCLNPQLGKHLQTCHSHLSPRRPSPPRSRFSESLSTFLSFSIPASSGKNLSLLQQSEGPLPRPLFTGRSPQRQQFPEGSVCPTLSLTRVTRRGQRAKPPGKPGLCLAWPLFHAWFAELSVYYFLCVFVGAWDNVDTTLITMPDTYKVYKLRDPHSHLTCTCAQVARNT